MGKNERARQIQRLGVSSAIEAAGLKQSELAKQLGVRSSKISKIASGDQSVDWRTQDALEEALGLPWHRILALGERTLAEQEIAQTERAARRLRREKHLDALMEMLPTLMPEELEQVQTECKKLLDKNPEEG